MRSIAIFVLLLGAGCLQAPHTEAEKQVAQDEVTYSAFVVINGTEKHSRESEVLLALALSNQEAVGKPKTPVITDLRTPEAREKSFQRVRKTIKVATSDSKKRGSEWYLLLLGALGVVEVGGRALAGGTSPAGGIAKLLLTGFKKLFIK